MSVTTLIGTQWTFNSTIDVSAAFNYSILFGSYQTSSADYYDAIIIEPYSNRLTLKYKYKNSSGKQNVYYYSGGSMRWSSDIARNIVIIGGDDTENPNLIAWMEANAVQVYDLIYKAYKPSFAATADAIRAKTGSTSGLSWSDLKGFADNIAEIDLISGTNDADVLPSEMALNKTAYALKSKITGSLQNANGVSF